MVFIDFSFYWMRSYMSMLFFYLFLRTLHERTNLEYLVHLQNVIFVCILAVYIFLERNNTIFTQELIRLDNFLRLFIQIGYTPFES